MLIVVAFMSQKGGVGKSTLARALAAVTVDYKIRVKLADLDPRQRTVATWQERRNDNRAGPRLEVISCGSIAEAMDKMSLRNELLIIDAPAGTSKHSLEIGNHADLVVQPSSASLDDLDPAITLFHELVRAGVPRDRLVMALCRVASQDEEKAARRYVEKAGYAVLDGSIPERAVYREAHDLGKAVTETKVNARADALMGHLLRLTTEKVRARVLASQARDKTA